MGVKLGQKWAVKDGNLLASNQVGSRFFNKEFDFSRASNGTYVDRDGLLKTAELYNLIPYSEDFTQWQKLNSAVTSNLITSPSGVKNADLINYSITSSNGYIRLAHSAAQYITIYAKYKDIQWLMCYGSGLGAGKFVDIQNGVIGGNVGSGANAEIYDVGNGWKRIHFYSLSPNITQFSIYAAESDGSYASISLNGGVYLWGAQAVEGTEPLDYQYTNGLQGLPRISFEDGVGHLLLEPQRSNIITYSEDFSQWTNRRVSITDNEIVSPDGTTNASLITEDSTLNTRYVFLNLTVTTNPHSLSFFAKDNGRYLQVFFGTSDTTGDVYINFDLENGTYDNNGVTNPSIKDFGNGWWKISLQVTPIITSDFGVLFSPAPSLTSSRLLSYQGDGSSGFYIWGIQLEQSSYPTSYIKTEGTSVTRLADVCNNSGSAQDFNSEEGVLYFEFKTLTELGVFRQINISDGTVSNRIYISKRADNGKLEFRMDNPLGSLNFSLTENTSTDFLKVAFRYGLNNFAVFINGVNKNVNPNGNIFIANTLDQLDFTSAINQPFYGKVRNLQVFTEALSDAELISLTT